MSYRQDYRADLDVVSNTIRFKPDRMYIAVELAVRYRPAPRIQVDELRVKSYLPAELADPSRDIADYSEQSVGSDVRLRELSNFVRRAELAQPFEHI